MPPSDKLLFVHIPRTGGGSLINVLDDHYDVADIAPFWNPQDFASDGSHDLSKYKLIRGHCGPNEIERVADQGFSTITFLRDPLARTGSIYRWLRTLEVRDELADGARVADAYGAAEPTFDPESQKAIEAARRLSFEEFVETDIAVDFVSNGQTINLGTAPVAPNSRTIDLHSKKQFRDRKIRTNTLPRALNFIRDCLTVGIIEKYAESVLLLHYLMGWPLRLQQQNFHDTKAHMAMTHFTDRAREAVEQRNRADMLLYQLACKRFDAQFAAMTEDLGSDDPAELPTLINAKFRDKCLQESEPRSSVQVNARNAWPGLGWGAREFVGQGQYCRSIGPDDVATLNVTLDPTLDFGKPRVLSFFLQQCVDVDPGQNIRIDIDGQVLDFGGNGPPTSLGDGLPALYPFYWGIPFGKVYEHEGRLEMTIRLVDVDSSALVSVGAFEVS